MENLEIHETAVPTQWIPLPVKTDAPTSCGVGSEAAPSPRYDRCHGAGRHLSMPEACMRTKARLSRRRPRHRLRRPRLPRRPLVL